MKLYRTSAGIIAANHDRCYVLPDTNWDALINRDDLYAFLQTHLSSLQPSSDESWLKSLAILAPIGSQEVWAAGVTYLRSKTARMEESRDSGGATFYDKVYDAERPELFFKSTAARVIGSGGQVRIRKDSTWNVPEPELTLVVTSTGKIIGYTIGNDMSSRSIEGENPLYLPQAKMYDGSTAIGPCVLVTEAPMEPSTGIKMTIERNSEKVFEGSTTIDRMKRSHLELVSFLFREYSHRVGCYLMTGTCVVPENNFTLAHGDVVVIEIDGIGRLINTVA